MPDSLLEYWHWFLRLHKHRPVGVGIASIPYSEMQSFFDILGISPEPYEIEIIEMFDSIALNIIRNQMDKKQERLEQKQKKRLK